MSDAEEEWECPLCMEEMDIADQNFKPCPCGYQICRFCWNHINENLNGKCPACRRDYKDQTVEFKPLTPAELQRLKNEKRQKDRERKEMEQTNRRHLANMRVVQKNLVYVIGLRIVSEESLRQNEYFGQYGKILKIVINRKNMGGYNQVQNQSVVGVYVTFSKKEEAAKCIAAIDGATFEGRTLRATYGTTKYCSFYLRGLVCQNPNCMYLHEPGVEAEQFAKELEIKPHSGGRAAFVDNLTQPQAILSNQQQHGEIGPVNAQPVKIHDHHQIHQITIEKDRSSLADAQSITSTDDNISSPSALPRSAAWASTRKSSISDSNSKQELLECSIFDEIFPHGSNDPVKKLLLLNETELFNMAPLHRNFFLARQATEYYHQLISMPENKNSSFKVFAIKPFNNVLNNNSSHSIDNNNNNQNVNFEKSSRFQFAQESENLSNRLERIGLNS